MITEVLTGIKVRDYGCLVLVSTSSNRYDIDTELTTAQARELARCLTTAADKIEAEGALLGLSGPRESHRPTRSEQSLEGAAVNGLTPVGQEATSE